MALCKKKIMGQEIISKFTTNIKNGDNKKDNMF